MLTTPGLIKLDLYGVECGGIYESPLRSLCVRQGEKQQPNTTTHTHGIRTQLLPN